MSRHVRGFRNRLLGAATAIALALAGAQVAMGGDMTKADGDNDKAVPGELLVKFENTVSAAEATNAISNIGAEVVSTMLDGSLYLIRLPYPETTQQIREALEKTPGVAYVEPNFVAGINPPSPGTGEGNGDDGSEGGGPITIE